MKPGNLIRLKGASNCKGADAVYLILDIVPPDPKRNVIYVGVPDGSGFRLLDAAARSGYEGHTSIMECEYVKEYYEVIQ